MARRVFVFWLLAVTLGATAVRADTASVQIAWRLLDYIAVDYSGAVHNGELISEPEFAEMNEFAATARQRIAELPAASAQPDLQRRAEALQTLIGDRASSATVATGAASPSPNRVPKRCCRRSSPRSPRATPRRRPR